MMRDEPRSHRRFLILLGLTALATAPFPFVGREPAQFLGIPVWLWWSGLATASLSAVTVWGILRLWRDDVDDPTRRQN